MPPTLLPLQAPPPSPCSDAGSEVAGLAHLHALVRAQLATTPDLREELVARARAGLLVQGPPSAGELADALLGELCRRPPARPACRGQGPGPKYA